MLAGNLFSDSVYNINNIFVVLLVKHWGCLWAIDIRIWLDRFWLLADLVLNKSIPNLDTRFTHITSRKCTLPAKLPSSFPQRFTITQVIEETAIIAVDNYRRNTLLLLSAVAYLHQSVIRGRHLADTLRVQ